MTHPWLDSKHTRVQINGSVLLLPSFSPLLPPHVSEEIRLHSDAKSVCAGSLLLLLFVLKQINMSLIFPSCHSTAQTQLERWRGYIEAQWHPCQARVKGLLHGPPVNTWWAMTSLNRERPSINSTVMRARAHTRTHQRPAAWLLNCWHMLTGSGICTSPHT